MTILSTLLVYCDQKLLKRNWFMYKWSVITNYRHKMPVAYITWDMTSFPCLHLSQWRPSPNSRAVRLGRYSRVTRILNTREPNQSGVKTTHEPICKLNDIAFCKHRERKPHVSNVATAIKAAFRDFVTFLKLWKVTFYRNGKLVLPV